MVINLKAKLENIENNLKKIQRSDIQNTLYNWLYNLEYENYCIEKNTVVCETIGEQKFELEFFFDENTGKLNKVFANYQNKSHVKSYLVQFQTDKIIVTEEEANAKENSKIVREYMSKKGFNESSYDYSGNLVKEIQKIETINEDNTITRTEKEACFDINKCLLLRKIHKQQLSQDKSLITKETSYTAQELKILIPITRPYEECDIYSLFDERLGEFIIASKEAYKCLVSGIDNYFADSFHIEELEHRYTKFNMFAPQKVYRSNQ